MTTSSAPEAPEPAGVPLESRWCVCGKRVYRSAHHARRANAKARFRVRAYWCEQGRCWHATNAEKR